MEHPGRLETGAAPAQTPPPSSDADPAPRRPHDGGEYKPQPHRIVTTWPAGTFIENIAIDAEGAIYCTAHTREIFRIRDGRQEVALSLPDLPNGIVIDAKGQFWINGGMDHLSPHPNVIWRWDGKSANAEEWCRPQGAMFLNGMTLHPDGRLLTVDSRSGKIYAIDTERRSAEVWCVHECLEPGPGPRPSPGANGIKVRGQDVFVSVSKRSTLVRLPIRHDGGCGEPEVFARELNVDDFAIDSEGNFFLTTHPVNSLMVLSADGKKRFTIGGPDQGMVGSTACHFGVLAGDRQGLYVTTDGGMIVKHEGVLQLAKLVRIDTTAVGELLK